MKDENTITISLTRTGKVVTTINMKDNYKEIGRHNGEEQMREKENIIKEGVI